ncbi:MAG TPA: VOC family protein [Candidatus Binataceae bacterium]|nr:VOC family protein [Candidatus Binataceae bacterium]
MIKPGNIALGHIGLNVSDLDVSEGFYQEVLGLRVLDESLKFPSRYASMARDGKTVLTLWEQGGGRIKKRHPGLHHLAFEVDSVEEVNRTKGLLDNLGAHWTEGVRIYAEGTRAASIHFKDPDGIRIELYSAGRQVPLAQSWPQSEAAIELTGRAERRSTDLIGGDESFAASDLFRETQPELIQVCS